MLLAHPCRLARELTNTIFELTNTIFCPEVLSDSAPFKGLRDGCSRVMVRVSRHHSQMATAPLPLMPLERHFRYATIPSLLALQVQLPKNHGYTKCYAGSLPGSSEWPVCWFYLWPDQGCKVTSMYGWSVQVTNGRSWHMELQTTSFFIGVSTGWFQIIT